MLLAAPWWSDTVHTVKSNLIAPLQAEKTTYMHVWTVCVQAVPSRNKHVGNVPNRVEPFPQISIRVCRAARCTVGVHVAYGNAGGGRGVTQSRCFNPIRCTATMRKTDRETKRKRVGFDNGRGFAGRADGMGLYDSTLGSTFFSASKTI